MIMPPPVRKLALAAHLFVSVGWICAVAGYVAFGVAASRSTHRETVRAACIAMELIGWYVIVPLAVGSLLSGIVMSVGTKWGLFRYYWVLLSLALTTLAVGVLLLHMPTVTHLADVARQAEGGSLYALGGDLFHPGLGLVVLVVIQVVNVYQPPGMTPYRRRTRTSSGESRRDSTRIGRRARPTGSREALAFADGPVALSDSTLSRCRDRDRSSRGAVP